MITCLPNVIYTSNFIIRKENGRKKNERNTKLIEFLKHKRYLLCVCVCVNASKRFTRKQCVTSYMLTIKGKLNQAVSEQPMVNGYNNSKLSNPYFSVLTN